MGFERGEQFGTPMRTEAEMYKEQREYNKWLWDNNINDANGNVTNQKSETPKKSGFTK